MVYLDNSATTQVCDAAVNAMTRVMTEQFGNPSSLHTLGLRAEQEVSQAREAVAALIGAKPAQVVFTSGGTEANNLAILGGAEALRRRPHRAVTTAIEHASVAACFDVLEQQGWEVVRLHPDAAGNITPAAVAEACTPDTTLVSVMAVNNETGARTDIAAMTAQVRRRCPEALIHTDCVQAAGKLPIAAARWGVDLLSLSSHKLHGPKGCGALYIRQGARVLPRAVGGGQEGGLRSGTEPVPAIAGFGAAVAALPSLTEQEQHYTALREALLDGVRDVEGIRLHCPAGGVPYIVNLALMGLRSETVVHFLAGRDIYVSGGSACSRGKLSPVLTAMGLPHDEVDSSLRISFGFDNTADDVRRLCEGLKEAAATLQRRR